MQVEPLPAQLLDDLTGPRDPLMLSPLAGRRDRPQIHPVPAHMQVFRVLVHAGHLDSRHQLDPSCSPAACSASGTPAIASWSVSARVVTPAFAASATTSAGASCPSDTVECDLKLDQHGADPIKRLGLVRSGGPPEETCERLGKAPPQGSVAVFVGGPPDLTSACHINRLRRRVQEGPHSQPRRDRHPGCPHAEGDGHRVRRRLFRDRPRRAARAGGRRGLPDRPGCPGRELPERHEDHRHRQGGGRRGDPSRLRLPRRERRLRPRLRRGGDRLHRPAAGGDRIDGLEDAGARDHGRGRGADRPRRHRARQGRRGG